LMKPIIPGLKNSAPDACRDYLVICHMIASRINR
jgi:hypothetical protein